MLKRLVHAWLERQEKRVAYWQLQNMSERDLRDIGLSRSDIYAKVYR